MNTAFITGANKGIGREIARQLAARGVHVFIGARHGAAGEDAAAAVRAAGGRATAIAIDVTDAASVARAVTAFSHHADRLDLLINNAALLEDDGGILTLSADRFERTLRTNTLGPIRVTQAFWPLLLAARPARVINVSSEAGATANGSDTYPAYSTSKAALNAVTRQFAAAGRNAGIAVNAVHPGWVRTDMGGPNALRTVEQGADTAVWLALDALADATGGFFQDRKPMAW